MRRRSGRRSGRERGRGGCGRGESGMGWGRSGGRGGAKPGRECLQLKKKHRSFSHLWLAPHFLSRPSCQVPHPHLPHLLPPLLKPRHLPTSIISRWASLPSQPSPHPAPCPPPRPARLHPSCLLRCSGGCAAPVGPLSLDRGYPTSFQELDLFQASTGFVIHSLVNIQ